MSGLSGGGSHCTTLAPSYEPTVAEMQERLVFMVAHVSIRDFAFVPRDIQITPGETIIWTNYDIAPHTVTLRDGQADSGPLAEHQTFSHTFDAPGAFDYFCRLHPSMMGMVMVTD